MGCSGAKGQSPYVAQETSQSVKDGAEKIGHKISTSSKESKESSKDSISRRTSTSSVHTEVFAGRIQRATFIVDHPGGIDEAYDFEQEQLGAGSYGAVHKGCSKATGAVRAIKSIAKTHSRYSDWVRQEGKIMKLMDHPNIIKLFETYEDKQYLYLVMELCAGGGLAERLSKEGYFSEVQVAGLMRQILRTVAYMHKKGICHRDLKPENFLFLTTEPIERNVLKIIDFGVSCTFEAGQSIKDKAGTPYYTAPQILDGRYTEACDLWSCGVIMYIMLSGVPPFPGKSDTEVWGKIKRGNFAFQAEPF
jgi:calcium-dependent protein kinase